MFEELSSIFATVNDIVTLPQRLNTDISLHLSALEDKF